MSDNMEDTYITLLLEKDLYLDSINNEDLPTGYEDALQVVASSLMKANFESSTTMCHK